MTPFEVRTLPAVELIPADYNPRKRLRPTDKAYRKLKRSLERFGLVEPLVWNERTGRVVGGHLRLQILKELGVSDIAVSVVRLSDAEERALNVVLNNREAQGRYDPGKLAVVLEELKGLPEFAESGFGTGVLKLLNFEPPAGWEAEAEVDRVEVLFVMSGERYAEVQERLNALVGVLGVECHVRRG